MTTKRVLLVDDDADFLEIHRRALANAGYTVVVAHDAEAGYATAQAEPPDVVVLDVVMRTPDEGFGLARRLRLDHRTARIPLLMLTSVNAHNAARGLTFQFSDRDRDERFLPVDRFVEKPVSAARLVALVGELLGGRT